MNRVGIYLELGFSIAANVSEEEITRQALKWINENGDLEGFTLNDGQKPVIEVVHREYGEA